MEPPSPTAAQMYAAGPAAGPAAVPLPATPEEALQRLLNLQYEMQRTQIGLQAGFQRESELHASVSTLTGRLNEVYASVQSLQARLAEASDRSSSQPREEFSAPRMRLPTIRPFDPETEPNIGTWIFSATAVLHAAQLLVDSRFVPYLPSMLRGSALIWYQGLSRVSTPFYEWDAFSAALRLHFEPAGYLDGLRAQLRSLRQSGSVLLYTARFQELTLQLPARDPGDLKEAYLHGLRPDLRATVGQHDYPTWTAAAAAASRVAGLAAHHAPSSVARRGDAPPGFSHPPAYRGAAPMELGAVVHTGEFDEDGESLLEPDDQLAAVTVPANRGTLGVDNRKCRRCQKVGHTSPVCTAPSPVPASAPFQQPPRN